MQWVMGVGSFMFEWRNEDLTSFLLAHELPVYLKEDDTVIEYTKKYRDSFISEYENMLLRNKNRAFPNSLYESLKRIQETIEQVFASIISILCHHEIAEMANAQQELDALMDRLKSHFFMTGFFYDNGSPMKLFRVRATEEKLKERRELFHIPNKSRHLVRNERYSLAGAPCLYLATSLGIAWEECGMPKSFYFSECEISDKLILDNWKFITFMDPWKFSTWELLCVKNENIGKQIQRICSYLIIFPVIFSCSIVNRWSNSSFKEEYIFPQLILQWVKRNSAEVKGINYFSCIQTTESLRWCGHNVVLPTGVYDSCGYDIMLANTVFLSTPVFRKLEIDNSEIQDLRRLEQKLRASMSSNYLEFHELLACLHDSCNLLLSIAEDVSASPLMRLRSLRCLLSSVTESSIREKEQLVMQKCKHHYESDDLELEKCLGHLHELCEEFNTTALRRAFFWKDVFGGNDSNARDFQHI